MGALAQRPCFCRAFILRSMRAGNNQELFPGIPDRPDCYDTFVVHGHPDQLPEPGISSPVTGAGLLARLLRSIRPGSGIPAVQPRAVPLAEGALGLFYPLWFEPIAVQLHVDVLGAVQRRGDCNRAGVLLAGDDGGPGAFYSQGADHTDQDGVHRFEPAGDRAWCRARWIRLHGRSMRRGSPSGC